MQLTVPPGEESSRKLAAALTGRPHPDRNAPAGRAAPDTYHVVARTGTAAESRTGGPTLTAGNGRLHQSPVGIGGDELDTGQAAGGQVTEEPNHPAPSSAEVTCRPSTYRCPSALTPVAQQGVHAHDPAAFADLQNQRVGGEERVGAGASGRARNACTCSSRSLAIADTCDFDSRVIPKESTSFSIRRVLTPSR